MELACSEALEVAAALEVDLLHMFIVNREQHADCFQKSTEWDYTSRNRLHDSTEVRY